MFKIEFSRFINAEGETVRPDGYYSDDFFSVAPPQGFSTAYDAQSWIDDHNLGADEDGVRAEWEVVEAEEGEFLSVPYAVALDENHAHILGYFADYDSAETWARDNAQHWHYGLEVLLDGEPVLSPAERMAEIEGWFARNLRDDLGLDPSQYARASVAEDEEGAMTVTVEIPARHAVDGHTVSAQFPNPEY